MTGIKDEKKTEDETVHQISEQEQSAGVLSEILRTNNVYLGGSAMGRGFRRAARYYLENSMDCGSSDYDGPDVDIPCEESCYVVDLGIVVSQFYQWRKHFPRVTPYYAVKANPDPVLIQTLATLGSNFDCASKQEIVLVQELTKDLPRTPDIVYANPAKARSHIIEAVRRGITMMTFDNETEVQKCAAAMSSTKKKIQLILRIITDDSGSQCRLSSKFGAPRKHWRRLLGTAKRYGLEVVGVSFHVGSGCRDASKYDMALLDAKDVFDIGKKEFGFDMSILDIGGGFPGETHSLWNPADRDPPTEVSGVIDIDEELEGANDNDSEEKQDGEKKLMFFNEIATHVAKRLDEMFPASLGIEIIAEPGRYLVAACCTLMVNVQAVRSNIVDDEEIQFHPISDVEGSKAVNDISREGENEIVQDHGNINKNPTVNVILDELADYSKTYARQHLSQQEVDVYTDQVDFSAPTLESATCLLLPPEDRLAEGEKIVVKHTIEGMDSSIVVDCMGGADTESGEKIVAASSSVGTLPLLAPFGEAAVNGVILHSAAEATVNDDFSYYVNDGVYGGFNNIMFDHTVVRPRVLRGISSEKKLRRERSVSISDYDDGFQKLEDEEKYRSDDDDDDDEDSVATKDRALYTSTIFGPTCDSMDVIARSVLLPKLSVGSWLYFNNMGAYTMAAASSFNGFEPTKRFYVCSVQPEHFEKLISGPISSSALDSADEKTGC